MSGHRPQHTVGSSASPGRGWSAGNAPVSGFPAAQGVSRLTDKGRELFGVVAAMLALRGRANVTCYGTSARLLAVEFDARAVKPPAAHGQRSRGGCLVDHVHHPASRPGDHRPARCDDDRVHPPAPAPREHRPGDHRAAGHPAADRRVQPPVRPEPPAAVAVRVLPRPAAARQPRLLVQAEHERRRDRAARPAQ